jgi:hypothetical protein
VSGGATGRTFESTRVSAATVRSDVCPITSIHPRGRSANSQPKFSQKSSSDWPVVLSWIETSEHPWPITGNRSDSVEFTVNENSFCKFVLRRLRNE